MLSSSNSSISSRLSSPNSYRGGSDKMSYSLYGQFSHAEATEIISKLKDQSDDELRRLLNDKEAYAEFFGSFPEVKNKSNQVHDEVERGSLQLARNILEKEPHLSEIRNQCMIIRTTELAAAEEKLKELERQKEDTIEFYSLESLLQKLQDAIGEADLESDALQKQLLDNDIELSLFVEKYKSLRMTYHQRSLVHLAAKANF